MSPTRARASTGLATASLLGFLVGAVALALALHDVDSAALVAAFARAGIAPLLAGTAIHVAVMALYALRWRLLLGRRDGMPFARTLGMVGLGYLANYTLPGRPGEIVRAGLARGLVGVPLTLALASLLLEKVLDGLTILASALGYAAVLPLPNWLARSVLVGGAAFAIGGAALAAAALLPRSLSLWERVRSRLHPQRGGRESRPASAEGIAGFLQSQLEHVAAPIHLLVSRSVLPPVAGLGVVIWVMIVAHQAVLCLGVGIPFRPGAWLLFYAALGLASVVPGAPGYVGTYQLAAIYALGAFGIERELAIAVATFYQASRLLGALVVGSWAISREGLSAVRSAARLGGEPAPAPDRGTASV